MTKNLSFHCPHFGKTRVQEKTMFHFPTAHSFTFLPYRPISFSFPLLHTPPYPISISFPLLQTLSITSPFPFLSCRPLFIPSTFPFLPTPPFPFLPYAPPSPISLFFTLLPYRPLTFHPFYLYSLTEHSPVFKLQ